MPPARGGRRGRGRGRRGGRGGAASRARGENVVDVEPIKLGDDDAKVDPQTKSPNEEITSAEVCEVETSEASPLGAPEEDEGKPGSTRNLKRLRKTITIDSAAAEEHGAESDDEEFDVLATASCQELAPCRRSKRLRCKPTRKRSKPTGKRDLGGKESEDDYLQIARAVPRMLASRRSKRLRERLTSDYFDGDVGEDKDTLGSSSDDYGIVTILNYCMISDMLPMTIVRLPAEDQNAFGTDWAPEIFHMLMMIATLMIIARRLSHAGERQSAYRRSGKLMMFQRRVTLKLRLACCRLLLHQIGIACSFLIKCKNSTCSRSFHTFCLDPPLQEIIGTWECSWCKSNAAPAVKVTEVLTSKKIQRLVGHRRILQEADFQYQFLVKWQSLSHHHDCWVPLEWLHVSDPLRVQSYLNLRKEVYSEDQRKLEWFEVDRAIACRRKFHHEGLCDVLATFQDNQDFDGYEFLVKWKGLDYCEATWEPCCTDGVQQAVSMLVRRHKNASKRVNISQTCLDGSKIEEVHCGALYDYQLQGLQWLIDNFKTRRSVILADEMGLGKTVQVVCFLYHIIKESLTASPALILAPKSILLQWEKEFCQWASDLNVIVYQGDRDSRKCIQVHEMYSSDGKPLFDALVTSYEFVQIDKAVLQKFKWSTIGTPLQNNIMELFSLLHYIDPDEFSDPKADGLFSPIESGRDLTMDEKVARIHDILKPRMLRRMKSDVLTDSMPVKKWVEVPCALADSQRELYINILERNYSKLNSAIRNGRKLSLNNILMELRKCCNHPVGLEVGQQATEDVFLSFIASSGKLQLLHKLLPRLKERGNRVLIFSQMTRMLDILEDFLCSLGYKYARVDGQTSLSARQESIKEYKNIDSETFIFLMSTRAGGMGVDLPGADRVIIYDPDFNPFMDLQAQSRAHRIGQTRPVVVYQLITKCSVEERILQKSKQKLAIENMLMNSSKKPSADELQSILLHGAKTIVDRKISATSIHYDNEAIENLLKLDPSTGEKCSSDDNALCFAHGVEDEAPSSPKVEDLKVLKPATPKVDLGRGKRQRKVVNYADEVENEDSDDMYAPEGSSTSESSSSSSDDETDSALQLQIVTVPDIDAD
uniref:CHD3-type chromatin-remodeling factor PICKLE n=1 Tax=Oryza barthii TaxID=65489 RepID=A0A0D3EX12_9ORYZ